MLLFFFYYYSVKYSYVYFDFLVNVYNLGKVIGYTGDSIKYYDYRCVIDALTIEIITRIPSGAI